MFNHRNRRILVIDDNAAIHEDVRRVLAATEDTSDLDELRAKALGIPAASEPGIGYIVDSAHQGEEGYRMVCEGVRKGDPYAAAFVDMRMPPGWDGVETISRIWENDPTLEIVICTAYSDHSWPDLVKRLGRTDRLLILKKPFDPVEISQLACSLTEKWELARQARLTAMEMEMLIAARTEDLEEAVGRLQHQALHDALTGLSNRALLMERLDRCIARRSQENDYRFGLMFLDLDDFKTINDSLGHLGGDELLVAVSRRLLNALTEIERFGQIQPDDVARFAGDEFVLLVQSVTDEATLVEMGRRIHREFEKPFQIGGREIMASASFGIAMGEGAPSTASANLRRADAALYQAKAGGGGKVEVYREQLKVVA